MTAPNDTAPPCDPAAVSGSDQRLVGRLPLFVCKHCGHEWDDGDRYYCGCGGPYRIPNPDLRDSPNDQAVPAAAGGSESTQEPSPPLGTSA